MVVIATHLTTIIRTAVGIGPIEAHAAFGGFGVVVADKRTTAASTSPTRATVRRTVGIAACGWWIGAVCLSQGTLVIYTSVVANTAITRLTIEVSRARGGAGRTEASVGPLVVAGFVTKPCRNATFFGSGCDGNILACVAMH